MNSYKNYIRILLLLSSFGIIASCDDNEEADLIGNWVELSDFDGVPRSDAVGFVVGDKAYVGTGYDGSDRLSDFWQYDPEMNYWTQKADFPGVSRNGAVGLGTSTKGYIGTGYDGENRLKDFYEYDPSGNTWSRKADFGGSARHSATGFAIGDKIYIGTGYDASFLKDFWEYDLVTDTWTQKVSIPGSKRRDAAGFSLNGKGYLLTGVDNGSYDPDFYEYDPNTGLWTKLNSISDVTDYSFDDDYTTLTGNSKVVFTVSGKAYLATGGQGSAGSVIWEWDPTTDRWTEKADFEGTARTEAVGFGIGNRGYVTTGRSSSYFFDDIWAFDPDDAADTND
jgi:N-acetylneuraminic acid mutarotase